ncbi:Polysaccharide pyruvyl transferase [compost metagenome]
MKVGVIGVGLSTNVGDQLIAKCVGTSISNISVVDSVKYYDLTKGVYDVDYKHLSRPINTHREVAEKKRNHTIRFLKNFFLSFFISDAHHQRTIEFIDECDFFIIGGGHLLIDNFGDFGLKLSDIIKKIKLKNKKAVFWSVGVGARHSLLYRIFCLPVIKEIPLYTRDKNSFSRAKRLGMNAKEVVLDSAFTCTDINFYINADRPAKRVLGLFIMDPNESSRHSDIQVSREQAKEWWRKIIVNSIRDYDEILIANNGSVNDYHFIVNYIKPLLDSNLNGISYNVLEQSTSYLDVINSIEMSTDIIAQRLHAIIPSICRGKKTLGIKWDDKVENIVGMINSDVLIGFDTDADIVLDKLKNIKLNEINITAYKAILNNVIVGESK